MYSAKDLYFYRIKKLFLTSTGEFFESYENFLSKSLLYNFYSWNLKIDPVK